MMYRELEWLITDQAAKCILVVPFKTKIIRTDIVGYRVRCYFCWVFIEW